MLVANAWHARADALSSLVVAAGIAGALLGFNFADAVAAALRSFDPPLVLIAGGRDKGQDFTPLAALVRNSPPPASAIGSRS